MSNKRPNKRMQKLVESMAKLDAYQRYNKDTIKELYHEASIFNQRFNQLQQDKSQLLNQTKNNHRLQLELIATLRQHEKNQKRLMQEIEIKQRQTHEELLTLRNQRDIALIQKAPLQDDAAITDFTSQKFKILLRPAILLAIIASSLLFSILILLYLFNL